MGPTAQGEIALGSFAKHARHRRRACTAGNRARELRTPGLVRDCSSRQTSLHDHECATVDHATVSHVWHPVAVGYRAKVWPSFFFPDLPAGAGRVFLSTALLLVLIRSACWLSVPRASF